MIKQIGTKIYYCNLTGNVIKIIGDMQGYVKKTTFEEDCEIYTELKERDKNSIGLLTYEYGEYPILSKNSTGIMVDLKTKELVFSYDELPTPPQEPTLDEIVQEQGNKISILESENKSQDETIDIALMATDEIYTMIEPILEAMPVTYNIETKNLGGSKMVDMYVVMVQRGLKTIEQVPIRYREEVANILRELEK